MDTERQQAVRRALERVTDLVYPMQDYIRAYAQNDHLPQLEGDVAAVARRLIDEELARIGERSHSITEAPDFEE